MLSAQRSGFRGFLVCDAYGGDTRCGLRRLLLERLSADDDKRSKFSFMIWACSLVAATAVGQYSLGRAPSA